MVKCRPRQDKIFYLYSNKHHRPELAVPGKPKIIADYNVGKTGIDQCDQMLYEYSFNTVTRRWPFALFVYLLNVCVLNAYVIYKHQMQKNSGIKITDPQFRFKFIQTVAIKMMELQKQERSNSNNYFVVEYKKIADILHNLSLKMKGQKPNPVKTCHKCQKSVRESNTVQCVACQHTFCHLDASTLILCEACHSRVVQPQVEPPRKMPTRSNPAEEGEVGYPRCYKCGKNTHGQHRCKICRVGICTLHNIYDGHCESHK